MPSIKISKELNQEIYFVTFTIKNWYYIFDRHKRWDILLESLEYCQKFKKLKIYAWVFMLNHIHLIIQNDDVSGFVRDFKTFTSKEIKKNILATEPKVLKIFEGEDGKYEFWQKNNMPKLIESENYFLQKKNYIKENPVRRFYVKNSQDWIYSSANEERLLELEDINKNK